MKGLRRLPRRVGGPHHQVVRQSSHLAAVPLEEPGFSAAHAKAPPVHLLLPKEHATLLLPKEDGVVEPHAPSMQALHQVREAGWNSVAACTKAHTPLAGACEAVPPGAVHHGPTHRELLRARDGRLPTMQVMRPRRQKVTRAVIPALPCIFCGEPEEDTGHLRILCERDEAVALADKAMEFLSWKEHGCRWAESLMTGVVPGELKRLFAAVRAALSLGPAKAKLLLEHMIQIGEDGYARRNHRLTQMRQLPLRDRRKAAYAFLRGDTPFYLPAGRVRQLPPWNPFDGLPGSKRPFRGHRCMCCWCPSRTSHTQRPCPRFPSGWRRRRGPLANGSNPG